MGDGRILDTSFKTSLMKDTKWKLPSKRSLKFRSPLMPLKAALILGSFSPKMVGPLGKWSVSHMVAIVLNSPKSSSRLKRRIFLLLNYSFNITTSDQVWRYCFGSLDYSEAMRWLMIHMSWMILDLQQLTVRLGYKQNTKKSWVEDFTSFECFSFTFKALFNILFRPGLKWVGMGTYRQNGGKHIYK